MISAFEFFLCCVEDSIQKCWGFCRGKFLRELEGFVYYHFHWCCAGFEFVNCQPQNIAVHGGQALELPVLRKFPEQRVICGCLRDRAFEKLVRKFSCGIRGARLFPKMLLDLFWFLMRHVPLEEHLQRKLARLAPKSHRFPRRGLALRLPEGVRAGAALGAGESLRESCAISTAPIPAS